MATSAKQDSAFGTAMLDLIVAWIQKNMEPQDIFDDKQLGNWAEANDYTKEA